MVDQQNGYTMDDTRLGMQKAIGRRCCYYRLQLDSDSLLDQSWQMSAYPASSATRPINSWIKILHHQSDTTT